tara:strand:- start:6590 stop:7204 length:615 start_codon:yes stop_codon:yes gene_type:complete
LSDKNYNNPNIRISKVYTRTGDQGETCLVGGRKVSKDDSRICSYGEIDELNAYIGGCRQIIIDLKLKHKDIKKILSVLYRLQNELFNLGNMLATLDKDIYVGMPRVEKEHIDKMEKDIDYFNKDLPSLKSFVLPGGSQINVWFHISRTLCRKCERTVVALSKKESINPIVVKYLNRLSDGLFVWSRWINIIQSKPEVVWNPNEK